MSSLSPTLLNDGSFFVDFGESSENSFGVQVPYVADAWGGDAPATIPNPLATFNFYDPEPFIPYYIPEPAPGCVVGCAPLITPGGAAVPEPSLALIGGALLIFLLLVDAERRKETCAVLACLIVIAIAIFS